MLIGLEHGNSISISKLDMHEVAPEQRKRILDAWFNDHLYCTKALMMNEEFEVIEKNLEKLWRQM